MNTENDDFIKKRLTELSERAFYTGRPTYSSFLTLAEQETLQMLKLRSPATLFGGFDAAERKIAAFGDAVEFPIVCVKAVPKAQKFADALTHRDFLGSLMALGMRREVLGDIVICENSGYIFCLDSASDYLAENLVKVRHTDVVCKTANELPTLAAALPDIAQFVVSSERIDSIISAVFELSRNDSQKLVSEERVFVNSRAVVSASFSPKSGDVVSVRGFGRFVYEGIERETKKGRLRVNARVYR